MRQTAEKIDLAGAAERLRRTTAPTARERRRFRRLPIVVGGRMLDSLGREHECRTADMSPGDVRLIAPILPNVGERVVIYLDGFGRVTGNVARRGETDVAVIFDFSAHKREKMAEALTYAINQAALHLEAPPRITVREGVHHTRVETETGEAYEGEVLDFSLTGMTLRTRKPAPFIGDWVRVGGTYGRVARLIEGGFAIDFEPRSPRVQPA